MRSKIKIVLGDITHQATDAIVNAANSSLLGGGGVDGAIHRAAGPKLLQACKELNGCPTGQAKITKGYKLPSKYVIHTVGPIWYGGKDHEDKLLASCYEDTLRLAEEYHIKTIAFPSISTGVYGFPVERAAKIAIREIFLFLEHFKTIVEVRVVCFDRQTFSVYCNAMKNLEFSENESTATKM